jgi:hypothetical protein
VFINKLSRAGKAGREQGVLLLDIVVATAMILLVVTALASSFITALYASRIAKNSLAAVYLAQEKIEQLKSVTAASELRSSDDIVVLNEIHFLRHTEISAHPVYPALSVIVVTISWQEPLSHQSVSFCTYVFLKVTGA